jgi:cell wall-associated NlpC family hydrolase
MKRTKLLNITLTGSLIISTGCSNIEPKIENHTKKSKISIYNIMGISENNREPIRFVVEKESSINEQSYIKESYNEEPHNIEYISYQENNQNPKKIIHETVINNIELNAKSFLGTPYVWGATGPSKFDCSGFTQWVYRDVGITIPRVSKDQARVGKYISYHNLKRGDMVFFDTKKHRSGKVTHVGIYLGDGNFIHASSAGKKVVIYNFNRKNFYKERFLWGRRVTNNALHYVSN